ncbi:MAG TPA: MarR family transcriptional regulator, partial [Longimicrobiales bacterium]|nr:MarR family transcriptional regulator [Longimicrobiales bacterium]
MAGSWSGLDEFLGSASVFANTLTRVLEDSLAGTADGAEPLTLPQMRLLGLLARGPGLRVADIARLQCVSDTAASRAVDRLVQRELVDRSEDPDNRRSVQVTVTPDGRARLADYRRQVNRTLRGALGFAGAATLQRLTAVMDEMTLGLMDAMENDASVCFGCNLWFRE